MKVYRVLIIVSLLWIDATPLQADEHVGFVGIGLQAGNASIKGDLEETADASVGGTEVVFGAGIEKDAKFHSFFSMPYTNIVFDHSNDRFPFGKEELNVFRAAIIPNVCYKVVLEISGCLGIGFENIAIRDKPNNNHQNYGTIGGQMRIGRFAGSGLIGGVVLDYFEIEEKRGGVRSKSTFMPLTAAVGYQYQLEAKK